MKLDTEKQKVELNTDSVSITLFILLGPKALENKRKNPLIVDNKAVEIVNSLNFDLKPYIKKRAYHSAIVRTIVIDKSVKEFIKRNPDCTIINLGCGLDTRITRVDNGKIKWIDIDLPDVIELREKYFSEFNRVKFISKSIDDYSWIKEIVLDKNSKVLFIAEGIFPYFEVKKIKEIFDKLSQSFPNSEMILTVLHKFLVGKEITKGVKFKWGIVEPEEIEKLNPNIKLLDFWRMSDYYKNRQNLFLKLVSNFTKTGKNLNRVLHIRLRW